jgi:hypothetical protein
MKKLLIILAIVAIASIKSYSYTNFGYVHAGPFPDYQHQMTYTNTMSYWPGPLNYQLYIATGSAYIGTNVGVDSISGIPQITKNGSFTGSFNYVHISACAYYYDNITKKGYWGEAEVEASW